MKILIQQLEEVEDLRSGNAKVHNLADILFIAIAAAAADADSWCDVEVYSIQKNIAKKMIENKAHYVLALKGNQCSLHEAAMETARMVKPDSIHKEVDADHGRVEERICRVYGDLSFVQGAWNWEGCAVWW